MSGTRLRSRHAATFCTSDEDFDVLNKLITINMMIIITIVMMMVDFHLNIFQIGQI